MSPTQLDMSVCEQPLSLRDNLNDTAHNMTIELSDIQALVIEMRSLREEIRDESRANRALVARLDVTLSAILNRVTDTENRITGLEERVKALEKTTSEQPHKSLAATIDVLKSELNDRDQDLLLNDVEISCIPEQKGENVTHIVTTIADKLGVKLTEQDVVSAVRVGRAAELEGSPLSSRPRPIVVKTARRAVRDKLLQAARVRRGATTEGLGLPGAPCRFYVNERLTKVNRQLFKRARDLGRQCNWRFVWTRDGRIYVRQQHGKDSPRIRLRTESDLNRIFGREAVGPSGDC